jgi:hypothetical protein
VISNVRVIYIELCALLQDGLVAEPPRLFLLLDRLRQHCSAVHVHVDVAHAALVRLRREHDELVAHRAVVGGVHAALDQVVHVRNEDFGIRCVCGESGR